MATRIFVEKENGEIGLGTAQKDRLKVSAPSKTFVERSHPKTPLVGRTANINIAKSQSARKALGNLNRPLAMIKSELPKGKKLPTKKVIDSTSRIEGCSMAVEDCPEKENFFPCNTLDFESFEVPEEHRLSHLSLTGVPLMTFAKTNIRFADIIPVKEPSVSWSYDALQSTQGFLASIDEIDLPPLL
uniref:Securin n=1 Tax=Salvator merianae TaxID=96440 RepID=A0A8D0BKA2_SALMN